jgi:hypothetical protein
MSLDVLRICCRLRQTQSVLMWKDILVGSSLPMENVVIYIQLDLV